MNLIGSLTPMHIPMSFILGHPLCPKPNISTPKCNHTMSFSKVPIMIGINPSCEIFSNTLVFLTLVVGIFHFQVKYLMVITLFSIPYRDPEFWEYFIAWVMANGNCLFVIPYQCHYNNALVVPHIHMHTFPCMVPIWNLKNI